MQPSIFHLVNNEGATVFVRRWRPDTSSLRGIVLIAHGAAEHGGRYERIASLLVSGGYAVYAPDHRGHGKTAGLLSKGGDAGPDGFNGMIADLKQLASIVRERHAGSRLYLLGHSMGAALSQRFIQLHGDLLSGVMLSGSPGLRPNLEQGAAITAKAAEGSAATETSTLFQQVFVSYNTGFEPITTGYEWLSRDAAEVKRYVDDPWCGFPFTNRLVAQMSACALETSKLDNVRRIPKSLPIYLFSGTHDRVGGNGEFVTKLASLYRDAGIADVEVKLYPEGRHEMLNETNREEVHRDLFTWLGKH